ncbi:MAG: PTS sugar transporter subunit IIA [Deltaproteobacteria bacterium]|nr:PTS sugar transporter subunit IIA [Deltaproteobacteria bacterium]
MKIHEFLAEGLVLPALEARSKEAVLRELAEQVARQEPEVDAGVLMEHLLARERMGSTGVGEGVAIPHGKLPGLPRLLGCFARSPEGVEYDSMDGRPVHLFFLLVAPEDSAGAHLRALARISRLLKSAELRQRLMEAADREALYRTILEEDGKF